MALIDEVKARYSNQKLINLTRPDDQNQNTTDDVLLQKAVDDTEADFEIYAGITYDNTVNTHIATAILGVLYYLRLYTGRLTDGTAKARADWIDNLKALGKVTARDRILPSTTSELEPSEEKRDGETVRPRFDDSLFEEVRPGNR
jgi:phage gp36-like protein